jgi:hypothetical protein
MEDSFSGGLGDLFLGLVVALIVVAVILFSYGYYVVEELWMELGRKLTHLQVVAASVFVLALAAAATVAVLTPILIVGFAVYLVLCHAMKKVWRWMSLQGAYSTKKPPR